MGRRPVSPAHKWGLFLIKHDGWSFRDATWHAVKEWEPPKSEYDYWRAKTYCGRTPTNVDTSREDEPTATLIHVCKACQRRLAK